MCRAGGLLWECTVSVRPARHMTLAMEGKTISQSHHHQEASVQQQYAEGVSTDQRFVSESQIVTQTSLIISAERIFCREGSGVSQWLTFLFGAALASLFLYIAPDSCQCIGQTLDRKRLLIHSPLHQQGLGRTMHAHQHEAIAVPH